MLLQVGMSGNPAGGTALPVHNLIPLWGNTMKYVIQIACDNAAFAPDPQFEVAQILSKLAEKLESGNYTDVLLRDSNGNTVGFAQMEGSL
jgi:hypothetical protein